MRDLNIDELGQVYGAGGGGRCGDPCGGGSKNSGKSHKKSSKSHKKSSKSHKKSKKNSHC